MACGLINWGDIFYFITFDVYGILFLFNYYCIALDGPLSGILIMMSNIVIFFNLCHALNLNVVSNCVHCSCRLLHIRV